MEATNKKTEKEFDAVKMVREIRNQMAEETMNMTYEEKRNYLDKLLKRGKYAETVK